MLIKIPNIKFADSVWTAIEQTIGSHPAETGGVLGGNPQTGEITHFYFDERASRSPVTYTVAADRINPIIDAWNQEDVHLMGMIHSHPRNCKEPSPPDLEFARRILNRADNRGLDRFLIPIVQTAADGPFTLRVFGITRDIDCAVFEFPYDIAPRVKFPLLPIPSAIYRKSLDRVRDSFDLARLHYSMVIAIGCGGGASFIEDMARSGVPSFVLIDPGVVEESNLATQQYYRKDIGKPKVVALKKRIHEVNEVAHVTAIQKPIEALSDDDFRALVFERGCSSEDIANRLLCGLTDSFWAQMRTNLLALQFGLPALAAQVYSRGAVGEIVFTHPSTTRQCMRCILSQRYRAYIDEGFQNNVGSKGAQYYATVRLNAAKFFVAMAALHQGSQHRFWGPMLTRIGQRNCIQIRCDPDVAQTLGFTKFDRIFAGAESEKIFCDESVFLPQQPENHANGFSYDCPDCGGTGNLLDSHGRFEDTRLIVEHCKPQTAPACQL